MKTKILTASLIASALFAGLAATPAMAQNTNTPNIDQSQAQISARIQQGLQSGRITPYEAQMLYRRDQDIQSREALYKSDGRATPAERQQLRADVAALSAEVERAINNSSVVAVPQPGNNLGGIDSREFNLRARIEEGVRTGRLSQREGDRFMAREEQIERREAAFRSDGVVTQQERRQLRQQLNVLRDQVERRINPRG
ncbi:MAG: hypothetical protein HYX42_10780 [Polaromonas sp.]|uniref:hypothetical protein n=1 Tax=Polaromonas sp. TaxID=1869339 RepID=UPI0025F46FC3|nr:hypothetical protein [Polaromonas sp.]MBI2726721.1 hypothetical protein [Polaromonas sp.]